MFYNRIYYLSRKTFLGVRKQISYKNSRNTCTSTNPNPNGKDPRNNMDSILTMILLSAGVYLVSKR